VSENPCIGCHTNCCAHYLVTVTAHDVYRISNELGLPPAAFLAMAPAQQGVPAVRLSEGYFNVALRQTEGGACVFLLDLDGHRRCSVHAFKPKVCAVYPFTMDKDGGLWHRRDMLCPTTWTLEWSQQEGMRALIRQCREELRFHEEVVSRWNEEHSHGGTSAEFFEFMLQAVALAGGEAGEGLAMAAAGRKGSRDG
jgi:Fe-S-cluster containining protein